MAPGLSSLEPIKLDSDDAEQTKARKQKLVRLANMRDSAEPENVASDSELLQLLKGDFDTIKDLLTCGICHDQLIYEPYTLKCGHTYCYGCLTEWFDGNRHHKTCPECRAPVRDQPAPAFMVKQILGIFLNRTQLLPASQSKEYHDKHAKIASDEVEKDRKSEKGLFRGCFGQALRRLIYDESDHVYRCAGCSHEWERGTTQCANCDMDFEGEDRGIRDHMHAAEFWSDEGDEDDMESSDVWDDESVLELEDEDDHDHDHEIGWGGVHPLRMLASSEVSASSVGTPSEGDEEDVGSLVDFIEDDGASDHNPASIDSDDSDDEPVDPGRRRRMIGLSHEVNGAGWSPLHQSDDDSGDEDATPEIRGGRFPSDYPSEDSDGTVGHISDDSDEEDDSDTEGGVSAARPAAPDPPLRPWERSGTSNGPQRNQGMTLVDRGGNRSKNRRRTIVISSDEEDSDADSSEAEDDSDNDDAGDVSMRQSESEDEDDDDDEEDADDEDTHSKQEDSDVEMASSTPPRPARRRNYKPIREHPESLGRANNMAVENGNSSDEDIQPRPRRRRLFRGGYQELPDRQRRRIQDQQLRGRSAIRTPPAFSAASLSVVPRIHYAPSLPAMGLSQYPYPTSAATFGASVAPPHDSSLTLRDRMRLRFGNNGGY